MSYLEMALKAAREMDEGANRAYPGGTGVATKATNATKARAMPEMPEDVRLLEWNLKPAPVLLTTASLITDVDQFNRGHYDTTRHSVAVKAGGADG